MLENKRLVITGAAGSLGQATAKRAQQAGARVLGLDIVAGESLESCEEYRQVDLLDREATRDCFGDMGELDGLINIAGGFAMGDMAWDPAGEQWDLMFFIRGIAEIILIDERPAERLEMIEGAEHEVLMESDAIRRPVLDDIQKLFANFEVSDEVMEKLGD